MGKIVVKFGGSSLADAGQFRKVKNILDMDFEISLLFSVGSPWCFKS